MKRLINIENILLLNQLVHKYKLNTLINIYFFVFYIMSPTKKKTIIPVKKGVLSKYGYHTNKTSAEREKAIKKAIKHEEKTRHITPRAAELSIARHLNARSIQLAKTSPSSSSILKKDARKHF